MTLEELAQRFRGPSKRTATGLLVFCNTHDDRENPSLSLDRGDHGGLLVNCFAHCATEQILRTAGLTLRDLAPNGHVNGSAARRSTSARTIAATYDYLDGAGALLYQVVRFDPKGFQQRRPDGAGGWIWKLDDVERVLYRLPDLVEQARVFFVEGEKDADRLAGLGLIATTASGGASAWRDTYAVQLANLGAREVIVLPDNDPPGAQYAATIAQACTLAWITPKIIRLPGLGPKQDVSDWLDAGHTLAELEQCVAAWSGNDVPTATPEPVAARADAPQPIELHELLRRTYPDEHGIVAAGMLIHRALAVFGGAPKLGKSSLVVNLVLSRGRSWLGFATTAGRTLVVQAEIPEPELQKRVGVMLLDAEVPPPDTVFFVTDRRIKLDRPDGLALIRQHIERVRPDLLVIDPLARFMVGDESSTRDMGALIAALDVLIQEYDLTIIVVHHTGKPAADGAGAREGGHRLRGSSALFAAADSVLMLDRTKDGEGFRLSFELRHGKEPDPLYLTRSPHLWFVPAGYPKELLAVAFLVASGPLRWGHLAKAIATDQGASKRTAERLLDRTKKAGLIAQDAEGYYTATATYRHACSGGEVSA